MDLDGLLRFGHLTATLAFFALVAAVAGWTAWVPSSSRPVSRGLYGALAVGILAAIAFLFVVFLLPDLDSLVLVGEVALLLLFAAFWIAETVRTWDDPNPSIR